MATGRLAFIRGARSSGGAATGGRRTARDLSRAGLALSLALVAPAGCAPSLRVLAGTTDGAPLSVSARVTTAPERVRLSLRFDNRSADPVAVDLDAIAVRSGGGASLRVLGRPQRFKRPGGVSSSTQRVANEPIVVDPSGRREAELELPELPDKGPLSLQIPSLHRLGIGGQRPLPSMQVPLRLDEQASREANRLYDPFEE